MRADSFLSGLFVKATGKSRQSASLDYEYTGSTDHDQSQAGTLDGTARTKILAAIPHSPPPNS